VANINTATAHFDTLNGATAVITIFILPVEYQVPVTPTRQTLCLQLFHARGSVRNTRGGISLSSERKRIPR
jgi:hypothetical protein